MSFPYSPQANYGSLILFKYKQYKRSPGKNVNRKSALVIDDVLILVTLEALVGTCSREKARILWGGTVKATFWTTWKEQNLRLFEGSLVVYNT